MVIGGGEGSCGCMSSHYRGEVKREEGLGERTIRCDSEGACEFLEVARTRHQALNGLHSRHQLSHGSGCRKSELTVSRATRMPSNEGKDRLRPLPASGSFWAWGNLGPTFTQPHGVFPVHLQTSSFYKDMSHLRLGTHLAPVQSHLN